MPRQSLGSGRAEPGDFAAFGPGSLVEPGALVFEPGCIRLGADVYIGHLCHVQGQRGAEIVIGDGTFLGPLCHLHGLGGIRIGREVGVGAGVIMLTAVHAETPPGEPITRAPDRFGRITVGDGCDIGVGSLLLPGTTLGDGIQVGAGAVVRGEHPPGTVIAGVPARVLRMRGEGDWASTLSASPTP